MGHVETRVYRAGALEAESFPVDAVSEWLEQPDTGRVGRPVRPDDTFPMSAVLDRRDRSPDLAAHGVGFLIYGLLDVVVDGYDTVQAFDDYYDRDQRGPVLRASPRAVPAA